MIPVYVEVDYGTDYRRRWKIDELALYLLACGWQLGLFVYPELRR